MNAANIANIPALQLLDAELVRIFGEGLNEEQVDCLLDAERNDEAIDMLDDMEDRMGIAGEVRGAVADWLAQREVNA